MMPRQYPRAFRDNVVAVALRREASFAQIARDFGISASCVGNWVKNAKITSGTSSGLTQARTDENRELRKRIRLLEQENEVLRWAATYLLQGVLARPA